MQEPQDSPAHYIIRGGSEGRERLRILARVMQPGTHQLFERVGVRAGMACLEIGCGGGDVACDLARMVRPSGSVLATGMNAAKLEIARREAEHQALRNVHFALADITREAPQGRFDLVHARFLLTHLPDPMSALANMRHALLPGGLVIVQDIDFRGHFCYPDCPALWRYVDLYTRSVQGRGGDANIGPRLPFLLHSAGFHNVQVNVVQPAGLTGEVKLITPLTMENIADSILADGLAGREEVETIIRELYEYANTPGNLAAMPRIVEAWAIRQ